jgi:hypothetical protein
MGIDFPSFKRFFGGEIHPVTHSASDASAAATFNVSAAPASPTSLIPVLVTGIQQRRVRDAEESFHAKDFA